MNQPSDLNVAINAIRKAFQPLVCVVEVYGNESRLRFRVLGPNNKPVVEIVGISMRTAIHPSRLRDELQNARTRVAAKGFELADWTPPS